MHKTKKFSTWFAIIFFVAILLRFSTLGRNSLWFDEAWGVFRANQPLAETLAGNIEVGRPPLYYAALHYWTAWVGSSETAVRFPSALASLFSVGLIYLLGYQLRMRSQISFDKETHPQRLARSQKPKVKNGQALSAANYILSDAEKASSDASRLHPFAFENAHSSIPVRSYLGNRRVALVAMSLLAFSPLHVWYGQEVRMYIFIACLGLVAANGLAWGHWFAVFPVTAALTAGLYVDFPMIPLWIGLSAAFIVYWWQQSRDTISFGVWFVATAVSILLYQPWWTRFANLLSLLNNIHFFKATRQALNLPEFSASQYALMMIGAGLGLIIFLELVYKLLQKEKIRRFVTPFAVVLFILSSIAFVWPRFFGLKRVIATGWPYVCLLIAWLVVAWEDKRKQLLWYGLMGISLLATLVMLWAVPKDDWRSAVAYIETQVQPEDIVWIDPTWNQVAYEYYQLETSTSIGNLQELEQLAATDIWLVAERFPMNDVPSSASEIWLDKNLQLVTATPFYRLEVRHYQPKNQNGQ